ncbi:pirin family protein [Mucilaginibacter sp. X4EP1]|uniref:pirin family protein n=1 Tax=Mucilaginibacter sp. X4EP1 TaxID=2723092 RepID=UPI00216AA489|nr:pirin family protein [Mucilaginibacter sp. X4EP1]MCS3811985.1 hypothetical protein [Mucilaginibacter sp. X4EP1]
MLNTSIEGKNVKVGDLLVNRLLPGDTIASVGPFLLLDHGYPVTYQQGALYKPSLNEHPHRGLVAFTYVINGEVEHFDSLGNHGFARAGDAHWLSSGKGILHGERVSARLVESGGTLHAIQFWTNIPSGHKDDDPEYRTFSADDFPFADLPELAGKIRVLLGSCGDIESPADSLSEAFLYRVTLNAKSEFWLPAKQEMKTAVFVPDNPILVNGTIVEKSQLLVLENSNEEIALRNPGISKADAFILGGPEPDEQIVVQGPFAMNSVEAIAAAYEDFFAGKYGFMPKLQKH